jgi:hypothetical protein
MGTTQGNNGVWNNGGSRIQVGATVRPVTTPGTPAQNGHFSTEFRPVVGTTYTPGTPTVWGGNTPTILTHNLTHENIPTEPMIYEPNFEGTEVVTKKQPWIMDWMVDGIQPEGDYNVIPTAENTQGGNVTWIDADGKPIASYQGHGKNRVRTTSGQPSKRSAKKDKKQNGGVLRKILIDKNLL